MGMALRSDSACGTGWIWRMAVHAAGGVSVSAVEVVFGCGVYGTARGIHEGRHVVSVVGVGRRSVLAVDGWQRGVDSTRW